MNIIHFTHCFLPLTGGTTSRLRLLLQGTEDRHVLVVPQVPNRYAPTESDPFSERELFGNIEVLRVALPEDSFLRRRRYLAQSASILADRVKGVSFDLIHAHNPAEFIWAALLARGKSGTPLVYEAHTLFFDTALPRWKKLLPQALLMNRRRQLILEQKVMDSADAIIAQTWMIKERLQDRMGCDPNKIYVIPNGVDEERFNLKHVKPANIPGAEGRVTILYSGFLDPINGILKFLNIVAQLLSEQEKKRLRWVVLGRGPDENALRELARCENFIYFPGSVSSEEMPSYYKACDIFVIPRPSSQAAELFYPMKLVEAMSMECCVLVSDVGGMADLVRDGETGVLFDRHQPETGVARLREMMSHPASLTGLGRAARKMVLEGFTKQIAQERLRALYVHMTSKRGAP